MWTQHVESPRSSLCGFGECPCPNISMVPSLNSWGSWSRKGFGASPVQLSHFTRRREGRKLRSTAENPSSGVGPADRIARDEEIDVEIKKARRVESSRKQGLVSQEEFPEG